MRIAVWHNLPSGGGRRVLHDQVRGLVARGHTVAIWCPPGADRDFLPLSDVVIEQVVPLAATRRTRWEQRLRIPPRMDRMIAAMDAHCRTVAKEIMKTRPGFDLVLAHPCMIHRATAIGRFTALPSVLYQQEPNRSLYEAMPRLLWLEPDQRLHGLNLAAWRAAALDRRVIGNARLQAREEVNNAAAYSRILVNSYFSRESLLRAYGLDSEVCGVGVDLDRFANFEQPRERLVVGLGNFSPEKNLRLAIEAVACMPVPRPALAWAGNADYGGHLADMVALARQRGVAFTPHLRISDNALVQLLNRATAMVYAPRLEPFGLAPIEAGACGVPVVAVAEGGVRETVIDGVTGLLVPPRPDAIAAALQRLFSDPALATRLGQQARANALAHWALPHATDRIETALQSVLARSQGKAGTPSSSTCSPEL